MHTFLPLTLRQPFVNPSCRLRERFGPSPRPSPSMGRVLVTLFVSFCLRCNFFSSLRGLGGLWSMLLNHIAKIRWIEHTAKGFWNVNCTTLHNLNFTLKRLWCSRQNESVCMEMQTYRLVFFSTPPSKAKLPTFLTEGNLRNFILKLNLFSFVFFGFYHVFTSRWSVRPLR